MKESFYQFSAKDIHGENISMEQYKGKILLVVNSAIRCSFARDSYRDLEHLQRRFHEEGFEVLDFPCNQFHEECPEDDSYIDEYCKKNFNTTFPRFQKIDVNGENALPLFSYLTRRKKFVSFDKGNPLSGVLSSIYIKKGPLELEKNEIKWNFTKFLIDRNGLVKRRFECTSDPREVEACILRLADRQEYHEKQ